MFHFQLLTLFPDFFATPLSCSIPARARSQGNVQIDCVDIRDFTDNHNRRVDDRPYGGGPGMLMQVEPVAKAVRYARQQSPNAKVILLSPVGKSFTQAKARQYAQLSGLILVCGRYEGIDERIMADVDERLSLGEFVLSGGEAAALCVLDAVVRLQAGVLGDARSAQEDSFGEDGLPDCPHYTRPENFEGQIVPEVLLSGHHARIKSWRHEQSLLRVKENY
ncbi:MAG: tRNA (guanosine(37)-N1)-methyltransferase TrmD [Mariprofundales bacterium]